MNKYEALFEDINDPLLGSPQSKFLDIVKTADKDIVKDELDKFISKFVIMEKLLLENISEDELENKIKQIELKDSINLEKDKKSLYIDFTTNIVCKLDS